MIKQLSFIIIFIIIPVMSKPRYVELDEDDEQLFRAAFESPSYDRDQYREEEDDMRVGKIDLLKDGLWAIKTKIKELKAFNKALAANLLSTNIKVRELLSNRLNTRQQQHDTPAKKQLVHNNYQPQPYPMYEPQIPQDAGHQFEHDPYNGY